MDNFHFQARNRSGSIIAGEQQAISKRAVAESLFAKDLTPIIIESTSKGHPLDRLLELLPSKRVPLSERVIFSRQFATMISAGIPIVKALNVLKGQTASKPLREALVAISKDVESGIALSDALAKYPQIFNRVYVSMVHAGEVGGILDDILEKLADQMENDSEVLGKVRGALIYPGLLFCVMVAALAFIMVVVVPQLTTIFDQIDSPLPWNTKLLLQLSDILKHSGILVLVVLIAVVVGVILFVRSNAKAKHFYHGLQLKIPIFGTMITKINLSRFAQTLGALLGAGIPVLEALNVVAESMTNVIIRDEIKTASDAVRNGASLAKTLHKSKIFPAIVPEMIAIGEETGELEKILKRLANFYSKEVAVVVANLSTVIEPVMLIFMGMAVGFVVVSVIGPIYQLTSAI